MKDIIHVLPDSVASQIAAGEGIQRPASAVKELLENAIDAGSSYIKVIVKDAGKTLIQVNDNGCGMSETDARLCLERHATSKIEKANDLFEIRTMGFRGEAMASICAIAHVELKSKRINDEVGTEIAIEGSEVKSQEASDCSDGTSVAIKNLFFNVPARRNFLKSDTVETRHIIDEFQKIAIANPSIKMVLYSNDNEVFHLKEGSLRQRLVGIFGSKYNQRLVPVEENASIVNIKGFVGKPEFAKKTRGEQFFFVNNRFIKNGYLHHAIQNAFQELISGDSHPTYFIFLELDPKVIDINIHPTKTEIKFENDRMIYAILLSAVKQSLGKYNIAPIIDFNRENSFDIPPLPPGESVNAPSVKVDASYNPFQNESFDGRELSNNKNWQDVFPPEVENPQVVMNLHADKSSELPIDENDRESLALKTKLEAGEVSIGKVATFQLHNAYIITQIMSGMVIMDQQNASERVIYEKYLSAMESAAHSTQRQLFSQTVALSSGDFQIYQEIESDIQMLGFDVRVFGKNTVAIEGIPADILSEDAEILIQKILEQYKNNTADLKIDKRDNLARSLAKNTSIKRGTAMKAEEMSVLIDQLFACNMPYYNADGQPTLTTLSLEELNHKFRN